MYFVLFAGMPVLSKPEVAVPYPTTRAGMADYQHQPVVCKQVDGGGTHCCPGVVELGSVECVNHYYGLRSSPDRLESTSGSRKSGSVDYFFRLYVTQFQNPRGTVCRRWRFDYYESVRSQHQTPRLDLQHGLHPLQKRPRPLLLPGWHRDAKDIHRAA